MFLIERLIAPLRVLLLSWLRSAFFLRDDPSSIWGPDEEQTGRGTQEQQCQTHPGYILEKVAYRLTGTMGPYFDSRQAEKGGNFGVSFS